MPNVSAVLSRAIKPIRSVGTTVAANLFNQVVVALSQLIVIPLLVAKWGTEGLGIWLLLTAIPNYLTISDFGFTTSAKTDMSIRAARGDVSGAQVTVSSVAALMTMAFVAIGIIYLSATAAIDWVQLLNLSNFNNQHAQIILAFGFVQIIGYQAFLLSASTIRAAKRPGLEVMLSALLRLAETVAFVVAAFLGFGLVGSAAAWAATRFLATLLIWVALYIYIPSLVPRFNLIDWRRVRKLLRPSLSYLLIPLANAISIQGTMLVLGIASGPSVAASFATVRIVTRMGVSAANVLNFAFTPQYSYAAGKADGSRFRSLLIAHAGALFAGTVLYILVMALFSNWFIGLLSHGQVDTDGVVVMLLVAAASMEMIWGLASSVGSALNRVGFLAVAWLGCAVGGIVLMFVLSSSLDISTLSAIVAVTHAAMLVMCLVWWAKYLKESKLLNTA